MKVLSIGLGIFILTCSAWAGKFLETFDDRDIVKQWQELTIFHGPPGVHSWKIVGGQLESLVIGADRVTRLFVIGNEEWQDYDIEVDVKPLQKHGPAHNGEQVLGPVILEAKKFEHVEVEFPDYSRGKVGFGVENYSVLFDNLSITTGDDIPKSVTPRTKLATTWGNLKQF